MILKFEEQAQFFRNVVDVLEDKGYEVSLSFNPYGVYFQLQRIIRYSDGGQNSCCTTIFDGSDTDEIGARLSKVPTAKEMKRRHTLSKKEKQR